MALAPQKALSQEILTQDIWRLMLKLSLPSTLAMSVNGINAFVDGLFVGQLLGQQALAAISLAFPLTMLINGCTAMIGVGASSLLSRAIGAGDVATQRKIFGMTTVLCLMASALLSTLGIVFAYELIGLLGAEGEVLELAVCYYRVVMAGAFFRVYGVAANMLIRAEGKIREAMSFSIIATLLNILLNPIFIHHLKLGIAGAAWATVAAMLVLTLLDLQYFLRKRTDYPVDLRYARLEMALISPSLRVGVSAMLLQVMFFVQQAVVFMSLDRYGTEWDFAFMGACYRVVLLLVIPCFGFAQAMQPVTGINYGAQKLERVQAAYRLFTLSSTGLILVCWVGCMVFPRVILGWMLPEAQFTPNDLLNFRMMMGALPAFPLFFMGTTLFQSVGNGRSAAILLLSRELLLFVPLVLVLPLFWGVSGIYASSIPVNLLAIGLTVYLVALQFRQWQGPALRQAEG